MDRLANPMRKLLFIFILVAGLLSACNPKVDPAEPTSDKAVVVQVWFTVHCEYCRMQIEILQSVEAEVGEEVEIVYIDPFDSPEEIVAFLQENNYSFEVATSPQPPYARGVPIMVVSVAGQDEPVFETVGVVSEADLLRVLYSILEKTR